MRFSEDKDACPQRADYKWEKDSLQWKISAFMAKSNLVNNNSDLEQYKGREWPKATDKNEIQR